MSREAPAVAHARGHRTRPNSNYGRITSIALDPVEKKPLVLWYPGSYVLSVGSYGCNPHCPFCQIAGGPRRRALAQGLARAAGSTRVRHQGTRPRRYPAAPILRWCVLNGFEQHACDPSYDSCGLGGFEYSEPPKPHESLRPPPTWHTKASKMHQAP